MGARGKIRDGLISIAIALLLITTAPYATGGGANVDIGDHVRNGTVQDLTDDHIRATTDGFIVDAPPETAEVRVSIAYIDNRIGAAWAADQAFTVRAGHVVVQSEDVAFSTFVPGPEEVFTYGSDRDVRFMDRPMWVAVRPIEAGVLLEVQDGDTAGQPIRVNTGWLANHGIENPLVVHEDGTVLDNRGVDGGDAIVVEVPHFSGIKILNPDLDQSWMTEGFSISYHANGPGLSFDFNVGVADVTSSEITFRFWRTIDGATDVFDEDVFNKDSRESSLMADYFSFNYVNNADLENGQADLGIQTFDLTDNLLSYVFTNGDLSYEYHLDHGWLKKVEDAGNGAEITAYAWGNGLSIPLDDGLFSHEVALTESPGLEVTAFWHEVNGQATTTAKIDNWADGDPDATVQSDILSGSGTDVTASAHYEIVSQIFTEQFDPCMNKGLGNGFCHTRAMSDEPRGLHVHWDDQADEFPSGVVTSCSGQDPDTGDGCFWDHDRGLFVWKEAGEFELEGRISHDLLSSGTVPFWYCGQADVWVDVAPSDDPTKSKVRCIAHEQAQDGVIRASPLGTIE